VLLATEMPRAYPLGWLWPPLPPSRDDLLPLKIQPPSSLDPTKAPSVAILRQALGFWCKLALLAFRLRPLHRFHELTGLQNAIVASDCPTCFPDLLRTSCCSGDSMATPTDSHDLLLQFLVFLSQR